MSIPSTYWAACEATVAAIRAARPTAAQDVVRILNENDPTGPSSSDAFWSASGSDDELRPLLDEAGWHIDWMQASYYWQMSRVESENQARQTITYMEGDVYANTPQQPPGQ